MKDKVYVARSLATPVSSTSSAPGTCYIVGARIDNFQPTYSCALKLQSSKDGGEWTTVVDFVLDDAAEVLIPFLYIEQPYVRVIRTASTGHVAFSLWYLETDK